MHYVFTKLKNGLRHKNLEQGLRTLSVLFLKPDPIQGYSTQSVTVPVLVDKVPLCIIQVPDSFFRGEVKNSALAWNFLVPVD
jgi:hypothetical protein